MLRLIISLNINSITNELGDSIIGSNFIYLDETTSTMDVARKYSNDSLNDGLVVFAEHQTNARGRLGRDWISEQNQNITFSILVYPNPEMINQLTILSSVIIARFLESIQFKVLLTDPKQHDSYVMLASHFPYLMACLTTSIANPGEIEIVGAT